MEQNVSTEKKYKIQIELTDAQVDALDMSIVSRKKDLEEMIKLVSGKKLRNFYEEELKALEATPSFFYVTRFTNGELEQ